MDYCTYKWLLPLIFIAIPLRCPFHALAIVQVGFAGAEMFCAPSCFRVFGWSAKIPIFPSLAGSLSTSYLQHNLLFRLATQSDSPPLPSGLRDLGSEVSLVAMAPLTAATALTVLSGSVWTYQLARSDFDTGIFLARVTAKAAEKVTWRHTLHNLVNTLVRSLRLPTCWATLLQVLFLAAFPGSFLFVFAKNIRSRSREFRRLETNPPQIEINPTETEKWDDDHCDLWC